MRKLFIIVLFLGIGSVISAQTPTLEIRTETPGLPSELFYGNVKVKPLRLRPGTNIPITIDDADFFTQQQYLDNLFRFGDAPGQAHWQAEITNCSDTSYRFPGETEAQCVSRKRDVVAAAFFLSPENQFTGSFGVRVYWGSLGQDRAVGRKCIAGQHAALDAVCRPLYSQYIADMAMLTQGIVVNNALDANRINANKQAFVNQFVTRPDFLAAYPNDGSMTAAQYVDKLAQTTGVPLTAQERSDLINDVGTPGSSCAGFASGRACVLFKMVDGATVISEGVVNFNTRYGKAYYDQIFNAVFVYHEYLVYLRRNADQAGFDFWLGKLNFYGNWLSAEMVRSFILSPEYRDRF